MARKVILAAVCIAFGLAGGLFIGFAASPGGLSDNLYSESSLPGGGRQLPDNERIHLSTDQRWIHAEGHLSDLIRLQWTDPYAKPSISWTDEEGANKAALIAHKKANNPDQHDHNHFSIETTMAPDGEHANELFTRFEIPFDQDIAEIRTHSSNFNVMDGILRIGGTEGVIRDLQFARAAEGNVTQPRWVIRTDATEETGSNEGSDLHVIRYSDEGESLDSALFIDRNSGHVAIGSTEATAKLDIKGDRLRIREPKTPASSTDTGNVGEIAWDGGYIYICVAENRWKRVALESW